VLRDEKARVALADELGPVHVPTAGGARLFWPRWRSTDPPARHRRWHPEELSDGKGPRLATTHAIARMVFDAAALRQPDPPLIARLEAAQARARINALEAVRVEREAEPEDESQFTPEEIELWENDLVELFEARRRIADLEADNERLMQAYLIAAGSETRTKTVADVIAEARRSLGHLRVLDTALESAARVRFARVDELARDLRILDELASARAHRGLGGRFTDECRARGLDWASGVSDTAEEKHGDAYVVRQGGKTYALGPHLRLADADGPLRVYCAMDHDVVVVGWVGRHLPDKTSG
jgi:hypothetical protein